MKFKIYPRVLFRDCFSFRPPFELVSSGDLPYKLFSLTTYKTARNINFDLSQLARASQSLFSVMIIKHLIILLTKHDQITPRS